MLRECPYCGASFQPSCQNQRYCCPRHRLRMNDKRNQKRATPERRAHRAELARKRYALKCAAEGREVQRRMSYGNGRYAVGGKYAPYLKALLQQIE